MKASEYAAQFKSAGSTIQALSQIVTDMMIEVAMIGKSRRVQTDAAVFSILEEMQQKWESFVRQAGPLNDGSTINPYGFEKMVETKMPDIHAAWMKSRQSRRRQSVRS